jgi:hypothetical protein
MLYLGRTTGGDLRSHACNWHQQADEGEISGVQWDITPTKGPPRKDGGTTTSVSARKFFLCITMSHGVGGAGVIGGGNRPLQLPFSSFLPNLTSSVRWPSSLHQQHKNGAKDMTRGQRAPASLEDCLFTQDLAIFYECICPHGGGNYGF